METEKYYTKTIYNKETKRNIILIYPLVNSKEESEIHNKKIAEEVFDILAMVKSWPLLFYMVILWYELYISIHNQRSV